MASQHNRQLPLQPQPHPEAQPLSADPAPQRLQTVRSAGNMAHSEGLPQRLRNEDSWVEISSQPSSSSLSSIGDEIVTTGLRVQQDAHPLPQRRRRRQAPGTSSMAMEIRHTGTSSQEEYEESESESDRVMTSSNEQLASPLRDTRQEYDVGSDSDGFSENATALGRRPEEPAANHPIFTPQPNAFSHPPSSQTTGRGGPLGPSSYIRRSSQPNPSSCSPFPNPVLPRAQQASSSQADHDAALRASLTTLLSIGAAAARGLPKRQTSAPSGNEPVSLRLVPESEIMPPAAAAATTSYPSRPLTPSTRARSSPSVSSQEAVALDKNKRKASSSASKPSSGEKAATRKKKVRLADGSRTGENAETSVSLSPTLLTWVVSAGVLVLVSVVGFGAGYVIGWEVGRQEGLAGVNGSAAILNDGTACGREVVRGGTGTLRRFRWGSNVVARSIVA